MDWSLVSAVNDDAILRGTLMRSPELAAAPKSVILQRGYSSAALAYNDALEKATSSIVVLAHQDVYFPNGWLSRVQQTVARIEETDPHWGVLGVWGVTKTGNHAGHVYCGGLQRELGCIFDGAIPVRTLDEVVLIVRQSSGLRFDPGLTGYHLYGTDLCLSAAASGFGCYAISAYCVHNTNGYKFLPVQFWRDCLYLRAKWQSELPVLTPCITITAGGWPMIEWNLRRFAGWTLGRVHAGRRVKDPTSLGPDRSTSPVTVVSN